MAGVGRGRRLLKPGVAGSTCTREGVAGSACTRAGSAMRIGADVYVAPAFAATRPAMGTAMAMGMAMGMGTATAAAGRTAMGGAAMRVRAAAAARIRARFAPPPQLHMTSCQKKFWLGRQEGRRGQCPCWLLGAMVHFWGSTGDPEDSNALKC